MTNDAHEQATALLTEIGRCYGVARRYRAIAADCETSILDPALAIGGALRAPAGTARPEDVAEAVRELAALLDACNAAVRSVRAGATYRAAEAAWDAGRLVEVAALAPAIFEAVVPDTTAGTLHLPVTVTARRGGEHFLLPAEVAARIDGLLRGGIARADPPPGLGADERLGVVVLETDAESDETPVALAVDSGALALPRFRLDPTDEVLVYTPRLRVPARVRLAASVSDEWWAVRPDAYATFAAELSAALHARGIREIDGP
ncbi:MAG TPA: hypothetical protein VGK30_13685 [Candidatus Binatia bacterium]|jgi:hypothetical protein